MTLRLLTTLLCLSIAATAAAQDRYLLDWEEIGEESIQHLVELIRINSTNPPGNETQVARYLEAVLATEGIDSKLIALERNGRS